MPEPQTLLTQLDIDLLRELVRPKHRGFLPDHVARKLQDFKPSIVTADAEALHPILENLVSESRARMFALGISLPDPSDLPDSPLPTLDSRERTHAEMLSVLLPYYAYTLSFSKGSPEEAITVVNEAIWWARASRSHRREAIAWNAIAPLYEFRSEFEKERHAYRHALQIATDLVDDSFLEIVFTVNLITALTARHKLNEASELLEPIIQKARTELPEEEQQLIFPRLLLNKGMIASYRSELGAALTVLLEAEAMLVDTDTSNDLPTILYHIGLVYRQLGDESLSLDAFNRMAAIALENRFQSGIIVAHSCMAESHIRLGDYTNASLALDIVENNLERGKPLGHRLAAAKRIVLCLREGKIEEGLQRCEQLLQEIQSGPVSYLLIATQVHYGKLLLEADRIAEAEAAFRRAIEFDRTTEVHSNVVRIMVFLARALLAQKQFDEALAVLDEATQTEPLRTDSEMDIAKAWNMKAEIAELKAEHQEALRCTRIGHKLELKVQERRADDSLQKARVLSEVTMLRQEAAREREEKHVMEKNLTKTLLAFEGKQNLLKRVEQRLKETLLFLENERAMEVIDVLKNTLTEFEIRDDNGKQIISYLGSIDQEFILRLRERWPDITRKQERLCGLIRAGLTSHEIANILGLTYEGMRAQRKRLRKRLGLAPDENLEGVIANV